ncbi:MAG: sigma-54-dependent Fis family transcriptional regulator [Gammaproteobacteria bacterium]|nr:sigma-54-dependent Fis family transcriptional regulator [Gammaproteobacteria bacterium]
MRQHSAHIMEIESVLAGEASNRDDLVVESWKRCVGEHRLDPERPTEAYIVPDTLLREHRERSERLIGIARESVEDLFRQIAGQNYVLLLTDEFGITVDYFGDHAFTQELKRAGLYLGAEWSEARAGTCGVGSCIATGKALTVHQSDHFDTTHTPLSCTASPIYNSLGQLSAVLDISLLRSPSPKVSQNLALHLVQGATRRIEHAGLINDMRSEWVLCLSRSPAMVDVDPEASLALDGAGRIIGMTHSAARILSEQTGDTWRRPQMLLGKKLQQFFFATVDDLPHWTRIFPAQQRRIVTLDNTVWYAHAIDPARCRNIDSQTLRLATQPTPSTKTTLPAALAKLHGGDKVLAKLLKGVAKLSKSQLPILIQGETGSGKEYLAKAIHKSCRPDGPFIAINCAAIPESLIEGELFGHAAGAYTGASRHGRMGLIESADGGTLFLDEIGDMPLALQARLLRFLSEGEVTRVGAVKPRKVDVRVLAASLHDLQNMVQSNLFRSDLYFRLSGAELTLPPLRQRDDFSFLVQQIIVKHSPEAGISSDALRALMRYQWPGNLRELDNVLQLALAVKDFDTIELSDLPEKIRSAQPVFATAMARQQLQPAQFPTENPPLGYADEWAQLQSVIQASGGNISRAARVLGINRSTLYRRLNRLQNLA